MKQANWSTPEPLGLMCFLYNENILAAYGSGQTNQGIGAMQAGLRAEPTDVETILGWDQWSVILGSNPTSFPSAHLTFNNFFGKCFFNLSYSRRVRRPCFNNEFESLWWLSRSAEFFSGTPDLNPEFYGCFELGHIKVTSKRGRSSPRFYFRNTTDKISESRRVMTNGFSVTAPYNLTGEKSFGVEFQLRITEINDWWKLIWKSVLPCEY